MFNAFQANYRHHMRANLSDELFKTWIAGWASCRGYQPLDDGNTVSVLLTDQGNQREHFLFEPSREEFLEFAEETRADPNRSLTVVTNQAQELLAAAQPLNLRMTDGRQALMCLDMEGQDVEDPRPPDDSFVLEHFRDAACRRVFVSVGDEQAARGSVAVQDQYAVYDRIVTSENFRRRGLGSYVMRALTAAVLDNDVDNGLLLASEDGRQLYQFLGWTKLADVFVLRG